MKANLRLGKPGVLTRPIPGSRNVEVILPEQVLDYASEFVPTDKQTIDVLPADTCFGARRYKAARGQEVLGSVVLMGSDRTSLHKPQYCLQGAGWDIVSTERITIPIDQPFAYDLPATKIIVTRQHQLANGQSMTLKGVYVYWYVADKALSGDPTGAERVFSLARNALLTGEVQRWAYVTFLTTCQPGQEDAAFTRLREFISVAVPDFQITQPEKKVAVTSQ
jgi:hypothetical protein